MSSSALHTAILKNDQALVEELLAGDGRQDVNKEVNGEYPIHVATKARNNKLVKMLVDCGANVNEGYPQTGSMQGYTALHFAARNGDIDLIQMLAQLGADLNRSANDGWKPIHAAAFGGKRPAMMALIECGADIDGTNPHGHTALTYSANYGRASDVRELLAKGAKADLLDKLGDTMLHHTFHYRMSKLFEGEYDVPDVQLDVAVLLALQKVDPATKNLDGETAGHYLEEDDWPSVTKFLAVVCHNADKLKSSKVEWNYMTFVNAKMENLVAMGLDLKHAMDLVELAQSVDRERIAAKKAREEARPAGGCPVMTGKKKRKTDASATPAVTAGGGAGAHAGIDISKADPNGPDPSGGQCPFFKKPAGDAAAAKPPVGPPVGVVPVASSSAAPKHHGHGDIDISKVDPNGPDPSGGQCPFFKKPAGAAPVVASKAAPAPTTPAPQAAPSKQTAPPAKNMMEFLQSNQQQVIQLLLAFFLGIWFEQTMTRLFGR